MSGWRKRTIMEMANEANLPACHTTHPKALVRFSKLVQAQRTWVGLTDEERKQARNACNYTQFMNAGEYAEAVQKETERILQELNT